MKHPRKLVNVGRVAIVVSTILGIPLTLAPGDALMGEGKQGFQYIQEYTGLYRRGFLRCSCWVFLKKTTSNAALFATIGGFIFSVILKFLPE